MIKNTLKKAVGVVAATAAVSALMAGTAQARPPFTPEELAAHKAELIKAVDHGFNIWHGAKESMTRNGLACGNCHPDTAAANPQTFPKFMPSFNRVVTYREMVNWCIENPQAGKALDVSGYDMLAMEAYSMYLHRGLPIEPGVATRQTTPIRVTDNFGYPRKPSGVGLDK